MGSVDYTFEFGGEDEDVLVTSSGIASEDELRELSELLMAHPEFRPGMRVLFDHRELDFTQMSTAELAARSERLARQGAAIGETKIALVVSKPADYGLLRMMVGRAGEQAMPSQIFRSMEDARAWLAGTAD